jgi:prepilin peptidase CpaA
MKFEIVFSLLMIELLIVSWIDFRTKKISNYWILFNLFLAFLLFLMGSHFYELNWSVFLFPLGFLGFGFILFLLNIMGAGDSKYLASLFFVTPFDYQFIFFEKIIISTLVIGTILLLMRFFRHRRELIAFSVNRHWKGIRDLIKSSFSYAPVISFAWILLGMELWK